MPAVQELALMGLFLVAACADNSAAPQATVRFVIDAPLCGSRIPVEFSIDRFPVGTDTFVVNLMPEHLVSRDFSIASGEHAIGARVPGGYVWPDSVVTLAAGEVFVDSLPFYCS